MSRIARLPLPDFVSGTPIGKTYIGKPRSVATVRIFTENGHYYAVDSENNLICQDSPTACFQEAINHVVNNSARGKIVVGKGDYYFSPVTTDALISINAPGAVIEIEGEPAIIHLPKNNNVNNRQSWLFTVANTDYDKPTYMKISKLVIVDDVNTGAHATNFLVTYGKGIAPTLEDLVFYMSPKYSFGFTVWLNNNFEAVVNNVKFLNLVRTGILFDSVSMGTVTNSMFISRNPQTSGTAIACGTGNIRVSNSIFQSVQNAFAFGDIDGATTLTVENSIFGIGRSHYFTFPNGSAWVPDVRNLIYLRNTSPLRIHIANSILDYVGYIAASDNTYNTELDITIANSYVRSLHTLLQFNYNTWAMGKNTIRVVNSVVGQWVFAGAPGISVNGRDSNNVATQPVDLYIDSSTILNPVLYDYASAFGIDNKNIGKPVSRLVSISNSVIHLKNTTSNPLNASIAGINVESIVNTYMTLKLHRNRIIADSLSGIVVAINGVTRNANYGYLDLEMVENEFVLNGASLILTSGIGNITSKIIRMNKGYTTEKYGTATLPAGSTSVTVRHGLVDVPNKIIVTPTGNVGSVWVSDVTSTSFTINVSTAPSVDTPIYWYAEV